MFSDLQKKMVCFPVIFDKLIWAGKNKRELPLEIKGLLTHASVPSEREYVPLTEHYFDLPSLANSISFNVIDTVFGEEVDLRLTNIYVIQLTNKISTYYKNYQLLLKAIEISEKLTKGFYPSFQMTWYKAMMYEVNQEISEHDAQELIQQAKAMLNAHEYMNLNNVLHKALTLNPACRDEINALFR